MPELKMSASAQSGDTLSAFGYGMPQENKLGNKVVVSSVSGASLVRTKPVFGPDSKCLFCCSGSLIKVYSTDSGECIRNLEGHTDTVTGIVVNPNNKLQILSCSLDQTIIQWDYYDGVVLRVYQLHYPLHHIGLLHRCDNPSLILKRQTARENYEIVDCNLPSKKDGHPVVKNLISTVNNDPNCIAVGCQNKVLAVVDYNQLIVQNQKKTVRHNIGKPTSFTCVACHPTDLCVVTGCTDGRIYYWYNIFKKDKVVKSYYHWHSLPVLDLCFTPEGSYLLSGGHECVVVKWQYNSHYKDFLPRLGAPINHVTCSQDNIFYVTCHTDNVIQLISNNFKLKHVYQGLTCGYHVTQKRHPVPAGLHFEPRSKTLVTNGKIGHLQFYSVTNDKHLYNLDIVGQNYTSPVDLEKPLAVTEVTATDFSSHGDWLTTVEMWDDGVMSPEIRLRFWNFKEETQQYTLNTMVEMPHSKEVTSVKIRPQTGEEGEQPMAVTTSKDGFFKTWMLVDDTNIYRQNTKWTCAFCGYYRDLAANIASYSEDGSLLGVGFGSVLTIWNPDTNVLLQTLSNHTDKSEIQFIEFGKYSCSHLLIVCSKESLTTWNLSTCTVAWSVQIKPVSLTSDPETDVMAVISVDNNAYFFRPSSPLILYQHDMVSQCPVVSAVFIPQTSAPQRKHLPTKSKLYFINSEHQLLSLSEVNMLPVTTNSTLSIKENLPQTTLSLILSKENAKQPVVETFSSTMDTKAWKEFLDTPAQVQPPVTSLCQQFIQSMLLKSGDNRNNINENEELSDVESVMDVDEVMDSDEDEAKMAKQQSKKSTSQDVNMTKLPTDKPQKTDSKSNEVETDTVFNITDMNWYKKKIIKE